MSHLWCQRIVQGLLAAGVQDLVVSPGSRSTPLLVAAIDSPLRLHSIIDERSAAFFALGRARADGTPVALLCTSGSAGAHYLPALLEARYAGHRVVAITADRPPELQDCGANQTIDQKQLLAAACPCLDLGIPEAAQDALVAVRRRVRQEVALARGPVHINAPFRKPLEPGELSPGGTPAATTPAPLFAPRSLASPEAIDYLVELCSTAERGLIVAGPSVGSSPGRGLLKLAEEAGFVLLAESTSGARLSGRRHEHRCDAFPLILASAPHAEKLAPDLILQFGLEPACGTLSRWLDRQDATRVRFCDGRVLSDSTGRSRLIFGDCADACQRLGLGLGAPARSEYRRAWQRAEEAAWAAAASHLGSECADLSEAEAIAAVLSRLPAGTQLTLGNSMPIRAADSVMPGHRAELRVLHQRGTSGIDGLIAGALGGTSSSFSALLLGDVSCSHDLSSLGLAVHARGPLGIIVIDNRGGQIFSHLPVAQLELGEAHWEMWRTTPAADMEGVCKGYGVAYKRVRDADTLAAALEWAQEQGATCVLHVVVASDSMRTFLHEAHAALSESSP